MHLSAASEENAENLTRTINHKCGLSSSALMDLSSKLQLHLISGGTGGVRDSKTSFSELHIQFAVLTPRVKPSTCKINRFDLQLHGDEIYISWCHFKNMNVKNISAFNFRSKLTFNQYFIKMTNRYWEEKALCSTSHNSSKTKQQRTCRCDAYDLFALFQKFFHSKPMRLFLNISI